MYDYDKALEIAQELKCEPILDLISWSENYHWSDSGNPLFGFYAIAQLDDYYGNDLPKGATYGYVEIGYIGAALVCYADRPNDVEEFLATLRGLENNNLNG